MRRVTIKKPGYICVHFSNHPKKKKMIGILKCLWHVAYYYFFNKKQKPVQTFKDNHGCRISFSTIMIIIFLIFKFGCWKSNYPYGNPTMHPNVFNGQYYWPSLSKWLVITICIFLDTRIGKKYAQTLSFVKVLDG